MAVKKKKSAPPSDESTANPLNGASPSGKAPAKKPGTRRAKTSAPSPAETAVASETAAKTETPKASPAPAAKASKVEALKTTVKKAAAPIKLNERQTEMLKRIQEKGETGYEIGQKTEQRTIDALMDRKLIKRGAKNKESGLYRYMLTKAGEKHMTAASPAK